MDAERAAELITKLDRAIAQSLVYLDFDSDIDFPAPARAAKAVFRDGDSNREVYILISVSYETGMTQVSAIDDDEISVVITDAAKDYMDRIAKGLTLDNGVLRLTDES